MPGVTQIVFGAMNLEREDITGKSVIDVGACDFNGSIRPLLESWKPSEYLGVDIIPGPAVDRVISADDLVAEFGENRFDVVVCLEMLEHSANWQRSVSNMKRVCKTGGTIILTTRSLGYPCHGFPNDFWRYEPRDMKEMFADFEIQRLECDPGEPGVFLKAKKPVNFSERDLSDVSLYCMMTGDRRTSIDSDCYRHPHFRKLWVKQKLRALGSMLFFGSGRFVSRVLGLK